MLKQIVAPLLGLFSILSSVMAQNQTIPGEITTPYPTLINLALVWSIEGDDNQNGMVSVKYRIKGNGVWRKGMPLRRVSAGQNVGFNWSNKHSGSIFDLTPNTLYEIQLSLKDQDGGSIEKIVEAHTRREPGIPKEAEIIELPPGLHDTLYTKSGTEEKPVVYQCTTDLAIYKHIDLKNKQWVYIEGLIVENIRKEGIGVLLDGARDCVIRGCTINALFGIVAYKPGATNCYISDNVITGISPWARDAMGPNGYNDFGEGIQMTGPGNVICFNRVTGFHDCISTMEDTLFVVNQTCIDIYNNDVYNGADDGIEADFCFSNCRIFRNRITNCYVGLSSQPALGGPTYFLRNVMYNVIHAAFKFKRLSQGNVALHNTVIKMGPGLGGNNAMDYAYFRNNLAIGGPPGVIKWAGYHVGKPSGAYVISPGIHSSFDYDAVGVYGKKDESKIGDDLFSVAEQHGLEKITLENTFHQVDFPYPPIPERKVPDLRLKPGSPAIDAAVHIPNINDHYRGKAPDCGAYEFGQIMPQYGPRLKKKGLNN